jgi:hypothetical protein
MNYLTGLNSHNIIILNILLQQLLLMKVQIDGLSREGIGAVYLAF